MCVRERVKLERDRKYDSKGEKVSVCERERERERGRESETESMIAWERK